MAKGIEKTVARALLESQRAEAEKARLAAMPMTLLKLIARAGDCGLMTHASFSTTGDLVVQFNDKYGDFTVLNLVSTEQQVRLVEIDIEHKEEDVAEERALEARRQAARAKLTHDDLDALGLS